MAYSPASADRPPEQGGSRPGSAGHQEHQGAYGQADPAPSQQPAAPAGGYEHHCCQQHGAAGQGVQHPRRPCQVLGQGQHRAQRDHPVVDAAAAEHQGHGHHPARREPEEHARQQRGRNLRREQSVTSAQDQPPAFGAVQDLALGAALDAGHLDGGHLVRASAA